MAEAVAAPAVMGLVMSIMPGSGKLKQLAGTVAYDAALVNRFQGGHPLTEAPWRSVTAPTLVIAGAKSPAWMRNAAVATTAALPHAELRVLPGQRHMVKPKSTAPELARFFAAPVPRSGASRAERLRRHSRGSAGTGLPCGELRHQERKDRPHANQSPNGKGLSG